MFGAKVLAYVELRARDNGTEERHGTTVIHEERHHRRVARCAMRQVAVFPSIRREISTCGSVYDGGEGGRKDWKGRGGDHHTILRVPKRRRRGPP